jgi:hypothetical protein
MDGAFHRIGTAASANTTAGNMGAKCNIENCIHFIVEIDAFKFAELRKI